MAEQIFQHINITTNLHPRLAVQLREQYNLEQMIETGTCYGDTAELGALLFHRVLTVELCPDLFPRVQERKDRYRNIEFAYGDSAAWLRTIDLRHEPPSLVWLDAHWTAVGPRPEGGDSPIIEEFGAIGNLHGKHVVLADDVRLFDNPGWPGRQKVVEAAEKLGSPIQYVGDIMVITPTEFTFQ